MASLFDGLEIGRKALAAHQAVLDTVGHNLANVSTPGYSRQRAELETVHPRNGVDVAAIRRLRDRYLDVQLLDEGQILGRNRTELDLLRRLESIVTDAPGAGLGAALDRLFQAFQDLSVHPTDPALRVAVRDAGVRVAATFRDLRGRLDQLTTDLTTEIQSRVADANAFLTEIADLNRQIVSARGGPAPNDLLDRRDWLVGKLGETAGVRVSDNDNGSVRLTVAGTGVRVLDGTIASTLTAVLDSVTDTVELRVDGEAVTPQSGALAALLEARNSPSGGVRRTVGDLDRLARAVIDEVNRVHASGAGLTELATVTAEHAVSAPLAPLTAAGLPVTPVNGSFKVIVHDSTGAVVSTVAVAMSAGLTTLEDVRAAIDADPTLTATIAGGRLTVSPGAGLRIIFAADTSDTLVALGLNSFFTGGDALTIAENARVGSDPSTIAAARADVAGLVHPGDGSNARAIARLRTKPVTALNSGTVVEFYATLVSGVGSKTRDASQAVDRQEAAVQLVENLQQQTAGVSTDEELVILTQAQHAYAAAARYVSTINDVLDTLFQISR